MVIEYEVEIDDVLAQQEYLYWKHPSALAGAVRLHRRHHLVLAAAAVVMTALLWGMLQTGGSASGAGGAQGAGMRTLIGLGGAMSVYHVACVAVSFVPGWSRRFRRKLRKKMKRMLRESIRRGEVIATGAVRLELLGEGIELTGVHSTTLHFWTAVLGVTTSPTHVFISLAPQALLTVPRRALGSEEAVGGFVQAIVDGVRSVGATCSPPAPEREPAAV